MSAAAAPSLWERPSATLAPGGRRAHFQHGPIDLILSADGPSAAVRAGFIGAWRRFETLLAELAAELPRLRRAARPGDAPPAGHAARRMAAAVSPHAAHAFVTPMAAVAGAVADEVLSAMRASAPSLARAAVNNGGDIALWLAPGERFAIAMADPAGQGLGSAALAAEDLAEGAGGVATSGWRGRSHSLGVADSVTVLARDAAAADVAATLIANAVDLPGHPGVARLPARALAPDSDLGDRLVTVAAPAFTPEERRAALAPGLACADAMRAGGLIDAAVLFLGGEARQTGAGLRACAKEEAA